MEKDMFGNYLKEETEKAFSRTAKGYCLCSH